MAWLPKRECQVIFLSEWQHPKDCIQGRPAPAGKERSPVFAHGFLNYIQWIPAFQAKERIQAFSP
jgi:hypothetical protein